MYVLVITIGQYRRCSICMGDCGWGVREYMRRLPVIPPSRASSAATVVAATGIAPITAFNFCSVNGPVYCRLGVINIYRMNDIYEFSEASVTVYVLVITVGQVPARHLYGLRRARHRGCMHLLWFCYRQGPQVLPRGCCFRSHTSTTTFNFVGVNEPVTTGSWVSSTFIV